jgi:outer membrane murein-binding lipoprotein Lpp
MSDNVRPELAAFRELEGLVRALTEEMAAFRRRALSAESRLRELEDRAGRDGAASDDQDLTGKVQRLEEENAALSERLGAATERVRQVVSRIHFLRQQTQLGGEQ